LGASLLLERSVREGEPEGADHLDPVAVVDRREVVAEVEDRDAGLDQPLTEVRRMKASGTDAPIPPEK
jgi:hypothetical protein